MSNAWEGSGKSGCWNPHFSRHSWELEEVEGLFRKLHPLVVRREVEDALSWKESRDRIFLLDPSTAPSRRPIVTLFLGVLFGGLGLL